MPGERWRSVIRMPLLPLMLLEGIALFTLLGDEMVQLPCGDRCGWTARGWSAFRKAADGQHPVVQVDLISWILSIAHFPST